MTLRSPTLWIIISTVVLAAATYSIGYAGSDRWYNDAQVQRGAALFASNCASCHGAKAQGLAEDWRKTDADGNYPPPPLNGSAHAWHHPMKVLRMTIQNGGARFGGKMPPFADKLKPDEIDAIIAWFQNHWSDEIYQTWLERDRAAGGFIPVGATSDPMPAKAASAPVVSSPAQAALRRLIPGIEPGDPSATPVPGLLQFDIAGTTLYVTETGSHALTGNLIDLATGENLTERGRWERRLELLAGFPMNQRVVYPANGEEKARIAVFTDTSCPYCRKQHGEVPTLLDAGISVHYLPFPRGGTSGPGYATLRGVWCAKDPLVAMDAAKADPGAKPLSGDCERASAVDRGYALGQRIGIRGTPATVVPNGAVIEGYLPAEKLVKKVMGNR